MTIPPDDAMLEQLRRNVRLARRVRSPSVGVPTEVMAWLLSLAGYPVEDPAGGGAGPVH